MKSLIFGYGVTGQSFERYLKKKNIVFEIYDANLIGPNINNILPDQKKLESYEMIYMSPGINLQEIYSKGEFDGIPYLTDIDIFFQEDHSYKIGITGTNGKSTCCYHMIAASTLSICASNTDLIRMIFLEKNIYVS